MRPRWHRLGVRLNGTTQKRRVYNIVIFRRLAGAVKIAKSLPLNIFLFTPFNRVAFKAGGDTALCSPSSQ
jgi:hypothetical protein